MIEPIPGICRILITFPSGEILTFEGMKNQTVQNGARYHVCAIAPSNVVYIVLVHVLVCRVQSKNCFTKEAWFAVSRETGVDGKNMSLKLC